MKYVCCHTRNAEERKYIMHLLDSYGETISGPFRREVELDKYPFIVYDSEACEWTNHTDAVGKRITQHEFINAIENNKLSHS